MHIPAVVDAKVVGSTLAKLKIVNVCAAWMVDPQVLVVTANYDGSNVETMVQSLAKMGFNCYVLSEQPGKLPMEKPQKDALMLGLRGFPSVRDAVYNIDWPKEIGGHLVAGGLLQHTATTPVTAVHKELIKRVGQKSTVPDGGYVTWARGTLQQLMNRSRTRYMTGFSDLQAFSSKSRKRSVAPCSDKILEVQSVQEDDYTIKGPKRFKEESVVA
jgi:hypothetical protein